MALSNRVRMLFATILAQLTDERERHEFHEQIKITASRGKHHRGRFGGTVSCRCADDTNVHFCKRHRCYVIDGKRDR